jgi:hypothetical protein
MVTLTDTTRNYEFDTSTFSGQTFTNSKINYGEKFGAFPKTYVATRLLSTQKFSPIESSESIILDTNNYVLRNKPERLEIVERKYQANSKVISRIKELAKYQKGWYDKIEGIPADAQTINDAITFVNNLDFNHIQIPYISLATDGEISFWWDLETIKLGLGFYGDGTYSYYAKLLENGKEFFGDDKDLKSTLPLEILEKLKK